MIPTARRLPLPVPVLLTVLMGATAAAGAQPAVLRQAAAPVAEVQAHVHAAVTAAALAAEDARRDAEGLPFRYALPVDLALTPANSGTWETLPDGSLLWRLRLRSPGALSLNVGCERALLPPTALLHVYPADDPGAAARLDLDANAGHGQLWTPVFLTDDLVVELAVPAADRDAVDLVVSHLGRGYRVFGVPSGDKSGPCNIDVVCSVADDWRDEVDTVAMISIRGSELCSGAMVNNTAEDGRPLFLTANHCGIDANAAPTLVAYWNYQSPACGQLGGGTLDQFTSGSTLLARYAASDVTLLELDETPDPAFGVKYAGWNRADAAPRGAVTIHHPSTDEKAFSVEDDSLTVTFYPVATPAAGADHLRVADWDLGTTEGGSSGAPLFDPGHRIIGQLHGGRAACGNDLADWYGRLFTSWEGGGTPDTRLRDHLDPLGTGAVTLDLLDPGAARFSVTPAVAAVLERVDGGVISPTAAVFTLANVGSGNAAFTAAVDAAWLDLDPAAGTLPEGAAADVTATPNAAALDLPLGVHVATVTFGNVDTAEEITRRVEFRVLENALTVRGPVPNPFSVPPVEIRCELRAPAPLRARVTDLRGLAVRDLGSFNGVAGLNAIPWDGRDDDGRLVPSGLYVVAVEGLGLTFRTRVTFVH